MPKLIVLAERRRSLPTSVHRHAEHLRGGDRVDVDALGERLLQRADVGHVGQDAQLDLRVVGRDQQVARARRTKASRILRPSSVRIGMFCRLGSFEVSRPVEVAAMAEAGVDAAGVRVDLLDQRVGVGARQLLQLAPVEDHARQLVARPRQLLQHLGAGGVGAGLGLAALAAEASARRTSTSPSCLGEPRLKLRPASL